MSFLNIEKIVEKPTWRTVLVELITTKKLDPWDVDITALTEGFLEKIKEMQRIELELPANIVLACAILLKFKSLYLPIITEEQNGNGGEMVVSDSGVIPQLEMVSRIPPKKPITLNELLEEMERVMKYERKNIAKTTQLEEVFYEIEHRNMQEEIESVLSLLVAKMDSEGWVMFSSILETDEPREIVKKLLPVLHLSQEEKLGLRQDEYFGEIFIKVLPEALKA
ncbi:MAG: segregation/condensation protein A [Candidatus Anstonellales archaeon]